MAQQGVDLEFEIKQEGWSEYATKDEFTTTIRLKMILMKLFLLSMDQNSVANLSAQVNPIFTVSVPHQHKGPKASRAYTAQEVADAVVEEDVKFDTIKEDWNEYKLPEEVTPSAKLVLAKVSRSSLHDTTGDPIYSIQHGQIVKVSNAKGTRQKYMDLLAELQTPSAVQTIKPN